MRAPNPEMSRNNLPGALWYRPNGKLQNAVFSVTQMLYLLRL